MVHTLQGSSQVTLGPGDGALSEHARARWIMIRTSFHLGPPQVTLGPGSGARVEQANDLRITIRAVSLQGPSQVTLGPGSGALEAMPTICGSRSEPHSSKVPPG